MSMFITTSKGTITMDVLMVIPFFLYLTRSGVYNPGTKGGAYLYHIHITPWINIGISIRTKKNMNEFQRPGE